MDPMTAIALSNALMQGLHVLLPKIEEMARSGQITPTQQQTVRNNYQHLRELGDRAFEGPEWEVSKG